MLHPNHKILYNFTVNTEREVDKTETREENGQKITTTSKVKELVPHVFAFKVPSRREREDADIERAAWVNTYVQRGLMLEADLTKRYANLGGILPDEERKRYIQLKADLRMALYDLQHAIVVTKDREAQEKCALREAELRHELSQFEQEQASFFDNTAEAKARGKLIEYLILHLTYFRLETETDWKPFFPGANTEAKLAHFDKLVECSDELLSLVKSNLEFLAAIWVSSEGSVNKESLDIYLKEQTNDVIPDAPAPSVQ